MSDPRTLVRVVDELLWWLRRERFVISTAQAIDILRALQAVGLERRGWVHETIAAIVLDRAADRARLEASVDTFFAADGASRRSTLRQRLESKGFSVDELDALWEVLTQLARTPGDDVPSFEVLAEHGAAFDRLLSLAAVERHVDAHSGPQLGFQTHRLLGQLGSARVRHVLASLRSRLMDALGSARTNALVDALAGELDASDADVQEHVRKVHESRVSEQERRRDARTPDTTPFASLTDDEIEEVRRAVRRFAERLRGRARVRARRALRGRIDPHATLRRTLRTAGVPFDLVRRRHRRHRPRLVLLCDVSDSVRAAAAFLLEFTYAAQELFDRARSFVFVSDLGETTALFAREPVRVAIARAWEGGVVRSGDNSNYGRVLRTFEAKHLPELDRRTTVVVLGDARTNYHDAAADVLDRVRQRSRSLIWLCPEPRGQWGQGDSAMALYAPHCTSVHEVRCAADLEAAARALVARAT